MPEADRRAVEERAAVKKKEADQKSADAKVAAEASQAKQKASVEAYYQKSEAAKPTPTSAEIDAALLGSPPVEKEDDGSGPEVTPVQVVAEAQMKEREQQSKPAERAVPRQEPRVRPPQ